MYDSCLAQASAFAPHTQTDTHTHTHTHTPHAVRALGEPDANEQYMQHLAMGQSAAGKGAKWSMGSHRLAPQVIGLPRPTNCSQFTHSCTHAYSRHTAHEWSAFCQVHTCGWTKERDVPSGSTSVHQAKRAQCGVYKTVRCARTRTHARTWEGGGGRNAGQVGSGQRKMRVKG